MSKKRKLILIIAPISAIAIALIIFLLFHHKDSATAVFAGTGKPGFTDGVKKASAFNHPGGIALEPDGSIIVADTNNNVIRRIKGDNVSTVAGSVKKSSSGLPVGGYEDGDAQNALFNKPRSVVCDSNGVIYVADTGNHVIRKIENGNVTTFAGGNMHGKQGYADGKDKEALFDKPVGMCMDKEGDIYVADSLNHVIRKIDKNGDVSTFAGVSSRNGGCKDGPLLKAEFNEPCAITTDDKGTFYVLDSGNQLVRKIADNMVTTLSGGKDGYITGTTYVKGGFQNGEAKDARFNFPKGITLTPKGSLLIADTWNNSIRMISADGKVSTVAGSSDNEGVKASELNAPISLLYSNGFIYVSDAFNNCVRMIPGVEEK